MPSASQLSPSKGGGGTKPKAKQSAVKPPPSAIAALPAAVIDGDLSRAQAVIETATKELTSKAANDKQTHTQPTSQETPRQRLLDIVLSLCCDNADRACASILDYVLGEGANPNPALTRQQKAPPLLRAIQCYNKLNPDQTPRVVDPVLRGERIKDVTASLLNRGADVHAKDSDGRTALFHAVSLDHVGPTVCAGCSITGLLLRYKADFDTTDNTGRTILDTAIWKNHVSIVRSLIGQVDWTDEEGRNAWHHLAGDPRRVWDGDSLAVADLLLGSDAATSCIAARDCQKRTCLHWAAATGASSLVKKLLDHPKIDINAREYRSRTPLWVAVLSNRKDIVDTLLDYRSKVADIDLAADGKFTPLHIACRTGSSVPIVQRLLMDGANPNARTLTGKTPLHLACEAGNTKAVELLLDQASVITNTADNYGNTPVFGAAHGGHDTIVDLLAPWAPKHIESLSPEAKGAAEKFSATIFDFKELPGITKRVRKIRRTASVFDVLYSDPKQSVQKRSSVSTLCPAGGSTDFRWIHLPVNNVAWCHELLTKRFIEEGAHDIRGFKALEGSFNNQHRGEKVHSSYMRPMCEVIIRASQEVDRPFSPFSVPEERHEEESLIKRQSLDHRKEDATGRQNGSGDSELPSAPADVKPSQTSHNVFLFAPYLHFETNKERHEMREAIRRAGLQPNKERKISMTIVRDQQARNHPLDDRDELLIRAHLNHLNVSNSDLHPRRTLDQSFYRTIDTDYRDVDQVVFKYERKKLHQGKHDRQSTASDDLKVLMVDQLWMWILGNDLIVTSFPQRWRQPPMDSMNVLESIIQELNLKTGDEVESIYDLAILITGRCIGTFDRSTVRRDGSRFLDMFESAIGEAMEDETQLFKRFKQDAQEVSRFLERKFHLPELPDDEQAGEDDFYTPELATDTSGDDRMPSRAGDSKATDPDEEPTLAIQTLLNIGKEAKLLAEVKDIRDELNMLKRVCEQQNRVLPEAKDAFETIIGTEAEDGNTSRRKKVHKRFEQYQRTIRDSIEDIERMDKQAERIYSSIRDLLDLKQKHANAFEAQYARVQATETARQGLTIMVFTVVTVIFLPLSFIAAFFAINISEFPHLDGDLDMSLGYVCRYVFGIGLGIAGISVLAALSVGTIASGWKKMWSRVFPNQARKRQATPARLPTGMTTNSAWARKVDVEAVGAQPRATWKGSG